MKNYPSAMGLIAFLLIQSLAITNILAQDEELGDIWLVDVEAVSPSNVAEYTEWGKAFKAIADETNFVSFFVASENTDFSYAWNIGKSYSGLDEFEKKFQEWAKTNTKVGELYTKYAHTLNGRTRYLWRHLPKYSYNPEGVDTSQDTYVRMYQAWVKPDKWNEAVVLLEEYKNVFVKANISSPFNVFVNLFGTDSNCIGFRQTFKDPAAWAAYDADFRAKTNPEQMQKLYARWTAVIIKGEDHEHWINSDLTHVSQ